MLAVLTREHQIHVNVGYIAEIRLNMQQEPAVEVG